MALIPNHTIPGVYGPGGFEVRITDKGYAIGWCGMDYWGGPFIEGSVRDIARDLIIKYSNILSLKNDSDFTFTNEPNFYGCIKITWNPIGAEFTDQRSVTFSKDFDCDSFTKELTQELLKLQSLLPFV